VLWQQEGADALIAAMENAQDPRLPRGSTAREEYQAACVFCLACERDPAHVDGFERWYEAPKAGYRVHLACIEGIVYVAEPERSAAFLARAITEEPRGGWLARANLRLSGLGTLGALLHGAYYTPLCTDELATAIERWLEYPQKDIAAQAHAVLRRHRTPVPDPPEQLRDRLKWEERFLREHGSPYGLMSNRCF
jgi:hypothetical protein